MSDELPEGWVRTKLNATLEPGGLFDGPFGSSLKTSDYTDSGVRVIRLENLSNLRFITDKETYISEAKYQSLLKHTVIPEDILVGSFVDGAVRVCLLPNLPTKAIAKADCFTVRTRPDIANRRFVAFQLGTVDVRDAFVEDIHGATRPRITTKQLRDCELSLAPLPEQNRIVEKVEALLEQVNRAKARLDRVPLILKRFRQAVLAAACSGELTREWRESHPAVQPARDLLAAISARRTALKLPTASRLIPDEGIEIPESELPDSWRWCRVGQIADVRLGGTPARKEPSYWNGSIPWVSSGEVANCRISGTAERITKKGLESSNAKVYPAGSVLIAMIGEGKTRGQSAILDIDACTNQNVAGLIFDAGLVNPEYIWYWALQEYTKNREEGRGGNQAALNGAKVRALPLPLPPVNEQAEIVRVLKNMLRLASAIDARVNVATTRANKLPQAILSKAFSGELVPTEAELARLEGRTYETAEELLKRVTALGSDVPSARKGRGTRAR